MDTAKMERQGMLSSLEAFVSSPRIIQFIKFCLVGGSGVVVDMTVLFLLGDPRCLGLGVTLSKIVAAEIALVNNFVWNEWWTFGTASNARQNREACFRRFLTFNTICGIGIVLAVTLLHTFSSWFGWNLYLSNILAIILVTFWNFGMNSHFNWHVGTINK